MAPTALARRGRSRGATSRASGRTSGRPWPPRSGGGSAARRDGDPSEPRRARGAACGRCVPSTHALPHTCRPSAALRATPHATPHTPPRTRHPAHATPHTPPHARCPPPPHVPPHAHRRHPPLLGSPNRKVRESASLLLKPPAFPRLTPRASRAPACHHANGSHRLRAARTASHRCLTCRPTHGRPAAGVESRHAHTAVTRRCWEARTVR